MDFPMIPWGQRNIKKYCILSPIPGNSLAVQPAEGQPAALARQGYYCW